MSGFKELKNIFKNLYKNIKYQYLLQSNKGIFSLIVLVKNVKKI